MTTTLADAGINLTPLPGGNHRVQPHEGAQQHDQQRIFDEIRDRWRRGRRWLLRRLDGQGHGAHQPRLAACQAEAEGPGSAQRGEPPSQDQAQVREEHRGRGRDHCRHGHEARRRAGDATPGSVERRRVLGERGLRLPHRLLLLRRQEATDQEADQHCVPELLWGLSATASFKLLRHGGQRRLPGQAELQPATESAGVHGADPASDQGVTWIGLEDNRHTLVFQPVNSFFTSGASWPPRSTPPARSCSRTESTQPSLTPREEVKIDRQS